MIEVLPWEDQLMVQAVALVLECGSRYFCSGVAWCVCKFGSALLCYVGLRKKVTIMLNDVGRLPDTFDCAKNVNGFTRLNWAQVVRRFAVVLRG